MDNKIDIQFLKRSLIFLVIALILSIAFIITGQQYESDRLAQYNQTKASLGQTHRTYKKLVEDLDLLDLYTKSYKGFKKSGLIGPERRLSWIETLESVNDVLQLPRLKYDLKPQEEFKRPNLNIDSNILVSSTPMNLTIDLLHEEDLFAVFEGIQSNIDNLFTIDSCSITRFGSGKSILSTKKANLTANCLLRWITVDVRN